MSDCVESALSEICNSNDEWLTNVISQTKKDKAIRIIKTIQNQKKFRGDPLDKMGPIIGYLSSLTEGLSHIR